MSGWGHVELEGQIVDDLIQLLLQTWQIELIGGLVMAQHQPRIRFGDGHSVQTKWQDQRRLVDIRQRLAAAIP